MILRTERAAEPEADAAMRAWLEPRASKVTPYPDQKGRAGGFDLPWGRSMASSSVLTYAEPDQMEAAHAAARAEVVPTAREPLVGHVIDNE
jgi:hypothetical protein